MKIAITADLHFGMNEGYDEAATSFLNNIVGEDTVDILVICGDAAETVNLEAEKIGENHRKLFKIINDLSVGHTAFCAGNHDIWTSGGADSWDIYADKLKEIADDSGVTYLDSENLYLDNVAVVGTYGHYDYSLATSGLTVNGKKVEGRHYESKTPPGYSSPVWNDGRFIRWDHKDREVCEKICNAFEGRLKEAAGRVERVVVATHTVPLFEMNGYQNSDKPISNFLNAFSGTKRLGEIILQSSGDEVQIRAFSAHTHLALGSVTKGGVEFRNVGGDYGSPRCIFIED